MRGVAPNRRFPNMGSASPDVRRGPTYISRTGARNALDILAGGAMHFTIGIAPVGCDALKTR